MTATSFQIVSHACMRVTAGDCTLLTDPWIVGSCYWRSWWNYPPVAGELRNDLQPDFIYLTHLHWDHFHGPSLRRFPRNTPVIVPFDRYERGVKDLRALGMENIIELKHGERMQLSPDIAITSYQISPFVTDSAVVIEVGNQVLLNANDAKLAGGPLDQILKKYPEIDFCFRSHSSANPRACIHVTDEEHDEKDNNEHYVRSFSMFMERVSPRFAIPFASNNCLLHDDTYYLNDTVQTPLLARDYFLNYARERGLDTKLKVMVSGDSWSSESGFEIADQDWFTNREEHLVQYRNSVSATLEKQRILENRIKVSFKMVQKFFSTVANAIPPYLLGPLKGEEVLLVARSEKHPARFAINLQTGNARQPGDNEDFDIRIEMPALVFSQAMTMNMFSHAGISKRVHYYAPREKMRALNRFNLIMELYEAEVIPIRNNLTPRAIKSVLPRWREGVLYLKVLLLLARGLSLPKIEERLLSPN